MIDHLEKLFNESWAILIGVGKFKDPALSHAVLPTTTNDINEIEKILTNHCGYPAENIIRILDSDATVHDIKQLFDVELSSKIQSNDRVLIFYSGHGVAREAQRRQSERGYITTFDTQINAKKTDWQSMLQLDEFIPFVEKRIVAKQIMFMIDCCFSGLAHQDPEYESQRENLCPTDMIKAAKENKAVQIYTAANKNEEILASAGVTPPISVFVESIRRAITQCNPNDYPEKFLSAHKLSKLTTLLIRETSIFLNRAQNPAYYFSVLDKFGEFVFKQFTDDEIKNTETSQDVVLEPIEIFIQKSELLSFLQNQI